jgi:archaellum component FlaF (FlaF/FlaG flagellin family)
MKKLILLITLLISAGILYADTISYCHIYYNKIKIRETNETEKAEVITLNHTRIKKADRIIIKYFYDTPSSDCQTQVIIKNKKQNIISSGKNKGTFNPIDVPVFPLLQNYLRTGEVAYDVYYFDKDKHRNEIKELIFKIIIK